MFGGKAAKRKWDDAVGIEGWELDDFLSIKEAGQDSGGNVVGDSIVSNAIKFNCSST